MPRAIIVMIAVLTLVTCTVKPPGGISKHFEAIKDHDIKLRAFLQDMPKGGDLHNHLYGAVYAESWLGWAEKDGLCLDTQALAITFPAEDGCGENPDAKTALADQALRNRMIDKLSLRDFVPGQGWSGHDQFFATFGAMAATPQRRGDMIADAVNLAGRQNILYLELMHTMELFETILPMVATVPMTGDAKVDYETLMTGQFGNALPDMVARARRDIDTAMVRKDELLGCASNSPQPGCAVEVRFLNQPVRTLPPAAVYAHMIFGWHLIREDNRFVGGNLVAPEDDYIALTGYMNHMKQYGYLQEYLGPFDLSLHAGELTLGLVHPKELRFHIREAIFTARAKRIGHGIDIVFETDYKTLLEYMAKVEIAVEINLTSNETILGIEGSEHPFAIYRAAGVPMVLSTDDEGVSRIDLTHEYVRAVQTFDLSYADIKELTYNSLKYSFLGTKTKEKLTRQLDEKFAGFESAYQ